MKVDTLVPKYLRVKHITELYPIGKSTIWALAKKGILHPIKASVGVTVFERSELEAFFNGKSQNDEVAEWIHTKAKHIKKH